MAPIQFINAKVFDGVSPEPREGCSVIVEGDTIREVAEGGNVPPPSR